MSVDNDYSRLNNIVGKFLAHKVLEDQREGGFGCAGDILIYCQGQDIPIPSVRPILWLNFRVADVIRNGSDGFQIEEVEGLGPGINFRWSLR